MVNVLGKFVLLLLMFLLVRNVFRGILNRLGLAGESRPTHPPGPDPDQNQANPPFDEKDIEEADYEDLP